MGEVLSSALSRTMPTVISLQAFLFLFPLTRTLLAQTSIWLTFSLPSYLYPKVTYSSWSTLSRSIFSPCYYSASCDELSPEHTNTSRSIYSFVYYRLLSNPSQNYKTHRGKHFLFISAGSSVPKTILCNKYFTCLIKQVLLLYVFIRIFSWFPFIHFQQDAWKVFPFRAVHILRYFLLFVLFAAVEYSFCTLCK